MPPKPLMKIKPKATQGNTLEEQEQLEGAPMSIFQQQRDGLAASTTTTTTSDVKVEQIIKKEPGTEGSSMAVAQTSKAPQKKGKGTTGIQIFSQESQLLNLELQDLPKDSMVLSSSFIDQHTQDDRFLPVQTLQLKPTDSSPSGQAKSESKGANAEFLFEDKNEDAQTMLNNKQFFMMSSQKPEESQRIWFQFPTQSEAGDYLKSLPPGKVGQMRVRKSGKTELLLEGVVHDVAYVPVNKNSMSQNVAAIIPPHGQVQTKACYNFGSVDHKVICTPKLE